MKLVDKEIYTTFVQGLSRIEGMEVEGDVESVVQTVNEKGEVRAQVVFFTDNDPQYMIDKRDAWVATLRGAQVPEHHAVADAIFPAARGVLNG